MTQPPHSIEGAPGSRPDPLAQVLDIVRTMLAAQTARDAASTQREQAASARHLRAENRADQREAEIKADLREIRNDIFDLRNENARQDRTQAHDGRIAEEALTLSSAAQEAIKAEAAKVGGARGGWLGLAASLLTAAVLALLEWIRNGGLR